MNTATQMLGAVIDASSLISAVSTFSESIFEDNEVGPPSFILVPSSPLERKEAFFAASSIPYAQLCYDPQQSTLVATMMETHRKGQRDVLPDSFPSLQPNKTDATCSSNSSCTSQLSNASTFTLSTMTDQRAKQEKKTLPFVLGTQQCHEKDENCMYLLAADTDKNTRKRSGGPGCARALQKLCKSRPFRFLQVHHQPKHLPSLPERIIKHAYEPVQSQKSLAKWC